MDNNMHTFYAKTFIIINVKKFKLLEMVEKKFLKISIKISIKIKQ